MAVRWIETRVATVGATETKESPSSVRWWILFGILGGVVLLSRSKSFGTPLVGNPCTECELAENPTRSQWALLAAAVTGGAALWLYKKKKSGTWTKVDMATYCFVPGKTYRFSLPSGHGDSEMVVQEAALAFGSKFSTTTRDGRTYFEGVWAHKPICPNQTGKQHIWAEVKS